jgi:glyoxylase-like metal-dependent hydrolase (beta-lactamase superfamily II)
VALVKQLAPGVWQLAGALPIPNAINTYLIDDVLVDAGARFDGKRILRQLSGRTLAAHVLTHAHPDHQGASELVCRAFGVPFWVGERDVPKAEHPDLIGSEQPDHPVNRIFLKTMAGPGRTVDRRLAEGDVVAGFRVLDVPGHSCGHIALWRESDRVLVLGDVLSNMDVFTGIPGLREPKAILTPDPAANRASARRLGELEPSLVCFGHGAPLRDTRKFVDFCAALAA